MDSKAILMEANAHVQKGDYEAFLRYCTDDTRWEFVGDTVLGGKEAVRAYMREAYAYPPEFDVDVLIAEGDFVTAVGHISLRDSKGKVTRYAYCDVWTLRDGKLAGLRAYVVPVAE